jgi:hypothetical protein
LVQRRGQQRERVLGHLAHRPRALGIAALQASARARERRVYNIHSGDFAAPVKKKEQIRCSTRLLLEFATHRFDNSEPKIQRNERKQLQAEDIDRVHCYMSTSPFGLELDPEIQWNERKLKIESPLHPL